MTDYKERMTVAKEVLFKRRKDEKLTKKDAIVSAQKFYEYNKKNLLNKVLEHFIYRMQRFNSTEIIYETKASWHEHEDNLYNKTFQETLLALIKVGLENESPDFCKYSVLTTNKPLWKAKNVYEKYLVIKVDIKE